MILADIFALFAQLGLTLICSTINAAMPTISDDSSNNTRPIESGPAGDRREHCGRANNAIAIRISFAGRTVDIGAFRHR